jgi:hypothetical protein
MVECVPMGKISPGDADAKTVRTPTRPRIAIPRGVAGDTARRDNLIPGAEYTAR